MRVYSSALVVPRLSHGIPKNWPNQPHKNPPPPGDLKLRGHRLCCRSWQCVPIGRRSPCRCPARGIRNCSLEKITTSAPTWPQSHQLSLALPPPLKVLACSMPILGPFLPVCCRPTAPTWDLSCLFNAYLGPFLACMLPTYSPNLGPFLPVQCLSWALLCLYVADLQPSSMPILGLSCLYVADPLPIDAPS